MWMFKPFAGKEPVGLEGRTIDVGNVKVSVQSIMAEGGFSCVYTVQDAMYSSKQYALKHMICIDSESLDLVTKEISVMKLLRGHPNVVTLVAHAILDMGQRKEAFLVMEFCNKSLVTMLENRGSEYLEENKILLIFRDICNAVCAMHSQSPPIAHRDLKAENILFGPGGAWKLCDFGSTSTNHKCFNRPEEMGIEEDNIRKYTTPAYRAPEMWDLLRRDVISEKVDIWALGCLLYRICYLKSAFDGESKLQVLNGNYRIPNLPKFSALITGLIKDMLQESPNSRPDILQIWFRVNKLLPVELQKNLPDGCAGTSVMCPSASDSQDRGVPRRNLMPQRSPPPPSSQESKDIQRIRPSQESLGAFWSTQHANDSSVVYNKGSLSDIPIKQAVPNHNTFASKGSLQGERSAHQWQQGKNEHGNPARSVGGNTRGDFQINFFQDAKHGSQRKVVNSTEKPTFGNEAYNTFVADFDNSKLNPKNSDGRSRKEELESEIIKLKEQLKKANSEKSEITSKYEKLTSICRSQRQEIQELKHALVATNPSPPSKDTPKGPNPAATPRQKIEGTIWGLQQGMMPSPSPSSWPEPKPWNAFDEKPKVGLTNGHNSVAFAGQSTDMWGFDLHSLASSSVSQKPIQGNTSQRFTSRETQEADAKQPAGWAGF